MPFAQQRHQQITSKSIIKGFAHDSLVRQNLKRCVKGDAIARTYAGLKYLVIRPRANVHLQRTDVITAAHSVEQTGNFALFTGGDPHWLQLPGRHTHISHRQYIDRSFAGNTAHNKSHFIHMRADHYLRTG